MNVKPIDFRYRRLVAIGTVGDNCNRVSAVAEGAGEIARQHFDAAEPRPILMVEDEDAQEPAVIPDAKARGLVLRCGFRFRAQKIKSLASQSNALGSLPWTGLSNALMAGL